MADNPIDNFGDKLVHIIFALSMNLVFAPVHFILYGFRLFGAIQISGLIYR